MLEWSRWTPKNRRWVILWQNPTLLGNTPTDDRHTWRNHKETHEIEKGIVGNGFILLINFLHGFNVIYVRPEQNVKVCIKWHVTVKLKVWLLMSFVWKIYELGLLKFYWCKFAAPVSFCIHDSVNLNSQSCSKEVLKGIDEEVYKDNNC